MKSCKALLAALLLATSATAGATQPLQVSFELPLIDNGDARRPFVAVWVESKGKAMRSLALWMDDDEWEVDLRRWWRKAGRYGHEAVDAVTSATRSAGRYSLNWDGRDGAGKPVPAGQYQLVLEAVREDGNRTLLKQPFVLGDTTQQFSLPAGQELGPVEVVVNPYR